MSLDIRLKKADRTYAPGDTVKGVVIVQSPKGTVSHNGLAIVISGSSSVQGAAKSMGVSDGILSMIRPLTLFSAVVQVVPPNGTKFPEGKTEIPFEFVLTHEAGARPHGEEFEFVETYHGVLLSNTYMMHAELQRGTFSKNWTKDMEFFVQTPRSRPHPAKSIDVCISPDELKNVRAKSVLPDFRITGKLNSVVCNISQPFEGELVVERCDAPIRSLELQLVRVESLMSGEGAAREATEIQNIQLADGDVSRGVPLPVYMVFPRLFTCPSMKTRQFAVEFEVNLVVQFVGGLQITENIPIKTYRA
jgi:hypothetical protein